MLSRICHRHRKRDAHQQQEGGALLGSATASEQRGDEDNGADDDEDLQRDAEERVFRVELDDLKRILGVRVEVEPHADREDDEPA